MFCLLQNYISPCHRIFLTEMSQFISLSMLPLGGGLLIYEVKKNMVKINSEMSRYHKNTSYLYTLLQFKAFSFHLEFNLN